MHPYLESIWEEPQSMEQAAIMHKAKFIKRQVEELEIWLREENPEHLRGHVLTEWVREVVQSIIP